MTEEQIALSRRAVACKGWRWMPGMRTYGGFLLVAQHKRDGWLGLLPNDTSGVLFRVGPDATPDLTDPAALGCLLALVQEAWGGDFERVWLEWYPPLSRWGVRGGHAGARSVLLASGATEAEALVAALEAAP